MLYAQMTDYVLLDEPMTYLDISSQYAIMENLIKMRETGKCVITVMHDMPMALEYADDIVLINGGKVIFTGGAAELLKTDCINTVFGVNFLSADIGGKRRYFTEYDIQLIKN